MSNSKKISKPLTFFFTQNKKKKETATMNTYTNKEQQAERKLGARVQYQRPVMDQRPVMEQSMLNSARATAVNSTLRKDTTSVQSPFDPVLENLTFMQSDYANALPVKQLLFTPSSKSSAQAEPTSLAYGSRVPSLTPINMDTDQQHPTRDSPVLTDEPVAAPQPHSGISTEDLERLRQRILSEGFNSCCDDPAASRLRALCIAAFNPYVGKLKDEKFFNGILLWSRLASTDITIVPVADDGSTCAYCVQGGQVANSKLVINAQWSYTHREAQMCNVCAELCRRLWILQYPGPALCALGADAVQAAIAPVKE
jgi:hypothetical protein